MGRSASEDSDQRTQSNTLPDVARLDSAWVPEFEKMGILTLDERCLTLMMSPVACAGSAMSTAKVDGHFYGLALNTIFFFFFKFSSIMCRLSRMQVLGAPKTMDEFVDAAKN